MPDLPIGGLPAAGALAGADLTVIVQGGVTVQSSVGAFSLFTIAAASAAFNLTKNRATNADPTINDDSVAGYSAGSRWENTDTGRNFVCRSAAVGAAVWTWQIASARPNFTAGNFYPGMHVVSAAAATVNTTAQCRLHPLVVPERMTIDTLGALIATISAGGNFQMAVFAGAGGLPLGFTVPTLSTGVATSVTGALNVDVQLEAGALYYLALATDNVVVAFGGYSAADNQSACLVGGATMGTYTGTAATQSLYLSAAHNFATGLNALNLNPAAITTTGATTLRNFLGHFRVKSIP